jgi:Golgi phosphoprotein 3
MNDPHSLYLHEEILLLALQDREGTVVSGAWYSQALAGALLTELILRGRLRSTGDDGKLEVVSTETLGEPLLDECLGLVAGAKKPKPMSDWLSKVANWKELKHRVAERLCERGILRSDTDKVLLFFERRIYPEVDPEPERAIIERLREAIFTERDDLDPRTVVILALAYRTEILKAAFDRKELKARKARIESVVNGDATGKAAQDVIEAVQMAVIFTACFVPVIVS